MNVNTLLPTVGGFVTSFIKKNKASAVVAPVLTSPLRFPHGPFQFHIRMAVSSTYEVHACTDLQNWSCLGSGTVGGSDGIDYVDSEASKFGFRFYRVKTPSASSANIVGYASVPFPPGFSMIANPLNAPSNTVGLLFPGLPDGTTFCKFDTRLFRLTNNAVKMGKWVNPAEILNPGEGALIFNPTSDFKTLHFSGDVPQGDLLNPIPAGFSIRSSLVPQPGRLNVELEFPLTDGDVIHIFDRDQQKYIIYPFPAKEWETHPPTIGVGESFWIGKTTPGNWARRCKFV